MKSRIIIADAHRLVAAGMERLLEADGEVISVAHDSAALLERVRALGPDIVVLDVPSFDVAFVARVRRLNSNIRIVVVTMSDDPRIVREAFRLASQ